jgi:hypothetical protein
MATDTYKQDDLGTLARWSPVPVWAISLAGFAYYVVSFGSFADNYGSAWAAALSLLWVSLFVMLQRSMPLKPLKPRSVSQADPAAAAEPVWEPVELPSKPDEPLAAVVATALEDDAAQEGVLGVMPSAAGSPAGGVLTDLERDIADWGFTYGVAWANARERFPDEPADVIAERALAVAREVFAQYMGDAEWAERIARERARGRNGSGQPA